VWGGPVVALGCGALGCVLGGVEECAAGDACSECGVDELSSVAYAPFEFVDPISDGFSARAELVGGEHGVGFEWAAGESAAAGAFADGVAGVEPDLCGFGLDVGECSCGVVCELVEVACGLVEALVWLWFHGVVSLVWGALCARVRFVGLVVPRTCLRGCMGLLRGSGGFVVSCVVWGVGV
jgi:hypothetical protein